MLPAPTLQFSLPKRVLWIISATGLISGWWQLRTLIHEWTLHLDMEIYRAGARALLDNHSLYAQRFDVQGIDLPFIYPPFGALLLAPFAMLSEDAAAVAIILISGFLTFGCCLMCARAIFPRHMRTEAFALAALVWPFALLSEPHTLNASFGQINVVIMALCAIDLLPRRRYLPQGAFVGIASAIKLTPLVMCLYFLLRRDYKALATTTVTGIAVTAATACWRWTDTKAFYTDVIFKMNSTSGAGVDTAYMTNQSFKGMIARWASSPEQAQAHQGLIDAVWLALSLTAIVGCALLMRQMLKRDLYVDAVMVNAALMLLISPISWSHHWVWLPLFAMVLGYRWFTTPGNPVLLGLSTAVVTLLILQIKPHWYFGDLNSAAYSMTFTQKLILSGYTWMAIAVLIAAWIVLRGTPARQDTAAEPSAAAPRMVPA